MSPHPPLVFPNQVQAHTHFTCAGQRCRPPPRWRRRRTPRRRRLPLVARPPSPLALRRPRPPRRRPLRRPCAPRRRPLRGARPAPARRLPPPVRLAPPRALARARARAQPGAGPRRALAAAREGGPRGGMVSSESRYKVGRGVGKDRRGKERGAGEVWVRCARASDAGWFATLAKGLARLLVTSDQTFPASLSRFRLALYFPTPSRVCSFHLPLFPSDPVEIQKMCVT